MRIRVLITLFIILTCSEMSLSSASTPTPSPAEYLNDPNAFLQFDKKSGADSDTYRLLDAQDRKLDNGNRNSQTLQESIVLGQGRAQQMVDMLKNEEMQKALKKVTQKGNQVLQENQELKNPAAVIAGAFSLWAGRTFALIKGQVAVSSHVEAKSRSGDFSMQSPLLNSKLNFAGSNGVSLSVNRKLSSIDTNAEISYNARVQTFNGQLSHPIAPHLDLSFGAGQSQTGSAPDGQAKLMYNLTF